MGWPHDHAKLERVQGLMAEEDLDALVVRAPDNVLYLTNFWGMKGYDAAVFPREGPPVLITIEPSAEDAADTAWTTAVVLVPGYDPDDPQDAELSGFFDLWLWTIALGGLGFLFSAFALLAPGFGLFGQSRLARYLGRLATRASEGGT